MTALFYIFPTNYSSLISLLFDATRSEVLTVLFYTPQRGVKGKKSK